MRQKVVVRNQKSSQIVIGNGNVISGSNITMNGARNSVQVGKFYIDQTARTVSIGHTDIPFHPKMKGESITAAGNHLIIDGFKLVDGEWVSIHKRAGGLWGEIKKWLGGK